MAKTTLATASKIYEDFPTVVVSQGRKPSPCFLRSFPSIALNAGGKYIAETTL